MKNVMLLSVAFLIGLAACAQPDHKKSPHDSVATKNIKVFYGRPYKKGREVCGADEATEITFEKDGTFGGKPVKTGSYTLFVTPNEKEWTIILNGDTHFWGTQYADHKSKDVLHIMAPVKALGTVVEQLTIRFAGSDMIIEWDKTQVSIPVSF
jgi:hypothetical protein